MIAHALTERRFAPAEPRHPADHPFLLVLETFGVAFLSFNGDGQVTHRSPRATELLPRTLQMLEFEGQLSRLAVRSVRAASRGMAGQAFRQEAQLERCGAVPAAAVYVSSAPRSSVAAVAMLYPATVAPCVRQVPLGVTRREAEVAALISTGAPAKQIARELGISEHTVRRHTEQLYSKIGVRSRAGLTRVWVSNASDAIAAQPVPAPLSTLETSQPVSRDPASPLDPRLS